MPTRSPLWFAAALALIALIVPYRAHGLTVFGLVDTGELFASVDRGVTWQARAALPVRDAVALLAGTSPQELFLAAASGSLHRSTDAGVSWTAISAVPASDVIALVPIAGKLLLMCQRGDIFASSNGGVTFVLIGTISSSDLVAATALGGSIFALSASGVVHRSDDAGSAWNEVGAITVSNAVAIAAGAFPLSVVKTEDNQEGVDIDVFDEMVENIDKDRPAFLEEFGRVFYGVSIFNDEVSESTLQWNQSLCLMSSHKATVDCVRAFSETDFRKDLAMIDVPTLIIHGDKDKTVPIEVSGNKTAKLLPNAKYLVYEDAPHGLFITEKDKLNADLITFINGTNG